LLNKQVNILSNRSTWIWRSDLDVGQLHAKYRKFTNLNSVIKTGCIDSGLNKPGIGNPTLTFSRLVLLWVDITTHNVHETA